MLRLLIIVVAFLIMIGGVVGGLYYWGVDPLAYFDMLIGKAPQDPNQPQPVDNSPSYVDFGILIVPVIQDRELKGQAEMILRLQVSQAKKQLVATNLPRLQHAFLQDMIGFMSVRAEPGAKLDKDAVSRRLTHVAQKTLGPDSVLDVIVEQASVK